MLILFAQREHLLHIRQVETENERTGLGGGWVSTFQLLRNWILRVYLYSRETKEQFVLDFRCMARLFVLLTLTWLHMTISWKIG